MKAIIIIQFVVISLLVCYNIKSTADVKKEIQSMVMPRELADKVKSKYSEKDFKMWCERFTLISIKKNIESVESRVESKIDDIESKVNEIDRNIDRIDDNIIDIKYK